MQTKFDLIDFTPFSFKEWKKRYQSDIRTAVKWDGIKRGKCGLIVANKDTKMYLPWYNGKHWMDGEPQRVEIGNKLRLVRLPALKVKDEYLILDGCHRMTELKPMLVLLDWLETPNMRYFVEMRNEYWFGKWEW